MTPSFLVLGWNTQDGHERARFVADQWSARLKLVRSDETSVILASSSLPRTIPSPDLVRLGRICGNPPLVRGGGAGSILRLLTRETWGNYLAIASGPDGCLVMVDPSGAGRAHLATDGDLVLVTDALTPALMRDAGLDVTVDIAALVGCLMDPGTIVSAPLLRGVVPMIAGVAYSLGGHRQSECIWAPQDLESEKGSGAALREAVDGAITGMLKDRTPLIELSGGGWIRRSSRER